MATLTVQKSGVTAGLAPTFSACAAGGDQFANPTGKVIAYLKNTNAATRTPTFDAPTKCNRDFTHDATGAVPATTGELIFGPFQIGFFNDANGNVQITYDAVTGLTIALVEVI